MCFPKSGWKVLNQINGTVYRFDKIFKCFPDMVFVGSGVKNPVSENQSKRVIYFHVGPIVFDKVHIADWADINITVSEKDCIFIQRIQYRCSVTI